MTELRDAALAYASGGMPVFPLKARGKTPLTNRGFHDASRDVQQVAAWWTRWPDANIGMPTGAVSGFVVVDVDLPLGPASLRSFGTHDRTAEVLTGSGGRHVYFAANGTPVRNSAGQLGDGLDVRADGGYVVLPPSVHETGNPYKWTRDLSRGVAQAPPWLLESAEASNGAIAPPVTELIEKGTRNQTLASIAGTMRRRGLTATEIRPSLHEVNRQRCRPPLPAAEVDAIANSIGSLEAADPVSNPPPESEAGPTQTENRSRSVDGAAFVFGVPEIVPAVWGEGRSNLWAKGEGLMLVGPDGVGKTTVLQQLALARIGLRRKLLDLAVEEAPRRVLYIAADRPRQAASSMRRMVTADDTDELRNRLVVWRGPLPINVVEKPRSLLDWIRSEFGDVSDVFVDSLKDIALDLTKDETGSRVNIAFQELIADSIELAVSHHQRKEHQGGGKPKRLADVYGSRWLTAGMGSVVLLWGEPGDLVVELRHLKQPVEEAGPWNVIHDHSRGLTTLEEGFDLEAHVTGSTEGITVRDAAVRLFTTADPSRNEIEKARRKLDGLVRNGVAYRRDDDDGTARYFGAVTPRD